jgi:hypothetical protein
LLKFAASSDGAIIIRQGLWIYGSASNMERDETGVESIP